MTTAQIEVVLEAIEALRKDNAELSKKLHDAFYTDLDGPCQPPQSPST